jgi:hypothetical protein
MQVLTMGGSGTSGSLRFRNPDTGELVFFVLGVHNSKSWCDIVTNLQGHDTAAVVNAQYYEGDNKDRYRMREAQTQQHSVKNNTGRNFTVLFDGGSGNNLKAKIIIN